MTSKERLAGVLLHPTSLPGGNGVGDLGPGARKFVDFLYESGQSLWQILPLGPPAAGNSPYSAYSSFAGNRIMISFEDLVADGFVSSDIVDWLKPLPRTNTIKVDFELVHKTKVAALDKVAERFVQRPKTDIWYRSFATFCEVNDEVWLEDYALFEELKEVFDGENWWKWEKLFRDRDQKTLAEFKARHAVQIQRIKAGQFFFWYQWTKLHSYANSRGVKIIGDIPIFVSGDSCDVWAHRDLFLLDEHGYQTVVAGVPPDYFSATGQLWGNPLYRWEKHIEDDFKWWRSRIRATLEAVDIVRLDHFRGFEAYWEVAAGEKTAINGKWVPAPGFKLFESMLNEFGVLPIIAEDLGIITREVEELRDAFHFPGMRILQFEFTDFDPRQYDPSSKPENQVCYTDTHDNNTLVGWFRSIEKEQQALIREYLHADGNEINWDFIKYAYHAKSRWVIVPLQDYLGLGGEGRMNVPGVADGNWAWRYEERQLTKALAARIKREAEKTGRCHGSKRWFNYPDSMVDEDTLDGEIVEEMVAMSVRN
ncbi:malQ protein [Hyaloraphidium curvatum]|nr:malQ protein [Hyaloraphidium curvatum]